MSYTQLADGTWQRNPEPADKPAPVRLWYMRENHSFRPLPLDVDEALAVMREERDAGQTYGMLCGHPRPVLPDLVHAGRADEWPAFEAAARPWLELAVARSKPRTQGVNRMTTVPLPDTDADKADAWYYTADQMIAYGRACVARIVAAERERCAGMAGEFARKWWTRHCATNKHLDTTRAAHEDFCALQADILRA